MEQASCEDPRFFVPLPNLGTIGSISSEPMVWKKTGTKHIEKNYRDNVGVVNLLETCCKAVVALLLVLFCYETKAFAQQSQYKYSRSGSYLSAVASLNEGNLQDAYDSFELELSVHPDNGYAHYYKALILYYFDYNQEALESVNEAVMTIPAQDANALSDALLLRAKIYLTLEMFDKSQDDYEAAIRTSPDNPRYLVERAFFLSDAGAFRESDADANAALKLDDGYGDAYSVLAFNRYYQEEYQKSVSFFDKAILLAPDEAKNYYGRSQAYACIGDIQRSVDDLMNTLLIGNEYQESVIEALSMVDEQYQSYIVAKFEDLMAMNEEDCRLPFYCGYYHYSINQYDAAIDSFLKSIAILPTVDAELSLAVVYSVLDQFEKALEYTDMAIVLDSDNAELYSFKGLLYYWLDDYHQASQMLDKALSVEESIDDLLRSAEFKVYERDFDGALMNLARVLAMGDDSYAHLLRSWIYKKQGLSSYAEEELKQVISCEEGVEMKEWSPIALCLIGERDEAISHITRALNLDPSAERFLIATACYSLLDDGRNAFDALASSIELGYPSLFEPQVMMFMDNIMSENAFAEIMSGNTSYRPAKDESITRMLGSSSLKKEYGAPIRTTPAGVVYVSGSINGYPYKDISFDNSYCGFELTLSSVQSMLRKGVIRNSDIAGGNAIVGATVKLGSVSIGGLTLFNIPATIVDNSNLPISFGKGVSGQYRVDASGNKLVFKEK